MPDQATLNPLRNPKRNPKRDPKRDPIRNPVRSPMGNPARNPIRNPERQAGIEPGRELVSVSFVGSVMMITRSAPSPHAASAPRTTARSPTA